MILTAMKHLELEVKKGRIQYYGLSAPYWIPIVEKKENLNISLNMILRMAHEASENHHFVALSYPMNIFEPYAAFNKVIPNYESAIDWSTQKSDSSIYNWAKSSGLIQITSRTLNCLIPTEDIFEHLKGVKNPNPKQTNLLEPSGLMYRLVHSPEHNPQDVISYSQNLINACITLEKAYKSEYERRISISSASENLLPNPKSLMWCQVVLANISRLDLETWKVTKNYQIKGVLNEASNLINKNLPEMSLWFSKYQTVCFKKI